MERRKRDELLALFDWNEEEEIELKKLSWTSGSWQDNLENRKYKHLTYLFEIAYALAIAPAHNITQNPTGDNELFDQGSDYESILLRLCVIALKEFPTDEILRGHAIGFIDATRSKVNDKTTIKDSTRVHSKLFSHYWNRTLSTHTSKLPVRLSTS